MAKKRIKEQPVTRSSDPDGPLRLTDGTEN
jgi:hypothetical protein